MKEWCITNKGNSILPLSYLTSRTKTNGAWDIPSMIVTFDWNKAKLFKDKEDALFYLNDCYEKFGKQALKWYPIKVETLLKKTKQKRNYGSLILSNTYRKDDIICPYCNYVFSDSWEYNDTSTEQEVECHECEKEFYLYVDFDVYYTTKEIIYDQHKTKGK